MARYEPVQLAFNCVEPDSYAKNKSPVIFVHGFSASKEQWCAIPEIIAKITKRKVYAVDSRNHGDSPWTEELRFDNDVDDLLNFMDSINTPKAIIVGHSAGGVTAMKVALRAPERVEKLVVEDISCRRVPKVVLDMLGLYMTLGQAAQEQVPAGVDEETARKIIFDYIFKGFPKPFQILVKPESANYRIQLKQTADGHWTFKFNMNVLAKALENPKEFATDPTGIYEGPTCFIYGKLSPFIVPLDEPNIRKFFPNVSLIGISDATHFVHSDCPREFTEALLNFLQT